MIIAKIVIVHYLFFTELNVRESDARVCDESSCKYGGICKEEGDGLKCACQFQVRILYFCFCLSLKHPDIHKNCGIQ